MGNLEELKKGFVTAYIDGTVVSSDAYKPRFVFNNVDKGEKVISSVEEELLHCDEFEISVAFITMGGITPLLQTLKELEEKNIPGKILTTNYLSFSEPKALKKLNELKNIELKMFDSDAANNGFHTKGYIFKKEEIYRIIIGSSNLTKTALTSNYEWNTKIISTEQGEIASAIKQEFNDLWASKYALSFDDFFSNYNEKYEIIKKQRQVANEGNLISFVKYTLEPNSMQLQFVQNLRELLEQNEERALLVSATGTGKTYASAFAMRELGFKKVLFLVHRNQLAVQAREAYKNVFDSSISMGIVGGGHAEYDADFIFATVETLSRDSHLFEYEKDAFDCIILDEAHHSPSGMYQKIMDYFTPRLFLGMTATPDRRDDSENGKNVYEIYNHKIALEIRLQQALEEDLLCPFHYFGITDLSSIDDEIFKEQKLSLEDFNKLTSDERVKHIIEKANYFGYSGSRVKGLIFCSRVEESRRISEKLNEFGLRTIALNGDAKESERVEAFERLAMEECEATDKKQPLDYIISVDILNEGVDIVEVNQVIMLRPTQSPIVFIQQLGRGLRKAYEKEYVVVLDFIGNYKNNFMIPIALSGDRTYNKDTIRKYVMEGSRMIPGASSVHFDEVARKKIFQSIDKMSTTKNMLKEKYYALKDRLGYIPSILDFYNHGEIDPMLFIEYSGTYDKFVRNIDKEYKIFFTEDQELILEFISNMVVNGKRPHELIMLKELLIQDSFDKVNIKNALEEIGEQYKEEDYVSACNVISKNFINSPGDKAKYKYLDIVNINDAKTESAQRAKIFKESLNSKVFEAEIWNLIEYGLKRFNDIYMDHDENNFVLYQKYSRKDVCRILNWEKDVSSTVYGYMLKNETCPLFVTYEKSEDISVTVKYRDEFEKIAENPVVFSNKIFSWMSKNNRTIDSEEIQKIINSQKSGLRVLLFIKKSDGEGNDFYYMGKVKPISWSQETIKNEKGKDIPIVNFKFEMEHEVRTDIFDYFLA